MSIEFLNSLEIFTINSKIFEGDVDEIRDRNKGESSGHHTPEDLSFAVAAARAYMRAKHSERNQKRGGIMNMRE